jgi:hypothetical protein
VLIFPQLIQYLFHCLQSKQDVSQSFLVAMKKELPVFRIEFQAEIYHAFISLEMPSSLSSCHSFRMESFNFLSFVEGNPAML